MKLSISLINPQHGLGRLGLLALISQNPLSSAELINENRQLLLNTADHDHDGLGVAAKYRSIPMMARSDIDTDNDTGAALLRGSNTVDAIPEDHLNYDYDAPPALTHKSDPRRSEKIAKLIIDISNLDLDLQVIVDVAIKILKELKDIEIAYDMIDKVTRHAKKVSLKWHVLDDTDKTDMLSKILKLIIVQPGVYLGEDGGDTKSSEEVHADTGVLGMHDHRFLGRKKKRKSKNKNKKNIFMSSKGGKESDPRVEVLVNQIIINIDLDQAELSDRVAASLLTTLEDNEFTLKKKKNINKGLENLKNDWEKNLDNEDGKIEQIKEFIDTFFNAPLLGSPTQSCGDGGANGSASRYGSFNCDVSACCIGCKWIHIIHILNIADITFVIFILLIPYILCIYTLYPI